MGRFFLTIILCFFIVVTNGKNPVNPAAFAGRAAPLSFIENKGQVTDQNHSPRQDIQFRVSAGHGLNIFIGSGAIHYQFSKPGEQVFTSDKKNGSMPFHQGRKDGISTATEMDRMDVALVGANRNAQVVTEEKQGYYENHITANAGGKGTIANAYNRVTYKDIYPNIDWALYVSNGELKHEFIIRPGGKVADIQLRYGGATGLSINGDGSLAATTPQGAITERAPSTYEADGKIIKSSFKLSGDILTYDVGSYSGVLVIDPTLVWATYYGGAQDNEGYGLSADAAGNVYMAGPTASTSGIATTGAYHTTYTGGGDAFLAKFNGAGDLLWATYFGGPGEEGGGGWGIGAAANNSGDIFIMGTTNSASGVTTSGAYQAAFGGGAYDVFLAKFNSAGTIQWATYFGGAGNDEGGIGGIAADTAGNVYIAGETTSTSGIATAGAYQGTYGGGTSDDFLAKFNGSGTLQWASYFGGPDDDNDGEIGIDDSANVFITGLTASTAGIATPGAQQAVIGGGYDAFLAKFSTAGAIQWATYYGGPGLDDGLGIVTNDSGFVFLTGLTGSTSGIATTGAYDTVQADTGSYYDAFLTKFSRSGALQWGTYFGGTGDDIGFAIAGRGTDVYIAGYTNSIGIAMPGAYQPAYGGGGEDAFLADFNSGGNIQWATYYGGAGDDNGYGVATDVTGNVFLSGGTNSTADIATPWVYMGTFSATGNDAFLAKFSYCTLPVAGVISGSVTVCVDSSITLADSVTGGTWQSRDTFIAEITAGLLTGRAIGTDTVLYSITNTCGTAITEAIINVVGDCAPPTVSGTVHELPLFSVFPNPADNDITIAGQDIVKSVEIRNVVGQLIYMGAYNTTAVTVSLARLSSGIYIVKVNSRYVYKIVKE